MRSFASCDLDEVFGLDCRETLEGVFEEPLALGGSATLLGQRSVDFGDLRKG